MARDFFINGESLVRVKNSAIGTSELGLTSDPITVSMTFKHRDIKVDAWGGEVPPEVQFMLAECMVSMTLIHLDRAVLDTCLTESMAGAPAIGQLPRAGARMGNNVAAGAATNRFISLNISSPVASKPWRFRTAYLANNPMMFPLGTEKSIVTLNWRVIPYTTDPWGGGTGSQGTILWDHTAD